MYERGSDIRQFFLDITNDDNWERRWLQSFQINGRELFKVEPMPTWNQLGNGTVSFGCCVPTWNDITQSRVLKSGFRDIYRQIWNSKLSVQQAQKMSFKAFVLLQFEVVRRWDDDIGCLSKDVVAEGIDIALHLDHAHGYHLMTGIFQGTLEERQLCFDALKKKYIRQRCSPKNIWKPVYPVYIHQLKKLHGHQILDIFLRIFSSDNGYADHDFRLGRRTFFNLKLRPSPNQQGNARLQFYPKLDTSVCFQQGFARHYSTLSDCILGQFRHVNDHNPDFQAFVTMQFEIARRFKNDFHQLTTQMVREGIESALDLDDDEGYELMQGMFEGYYDDKMACYLGLMQYEGY
uniref:Uncharacterized protein LOC100179903 n=1 Tax=Phallusia mammillata TaxID=59560 RepID=A0A6F9DGF2_9ASCI|nr:uncharacterized protein LOC100179903 [Phallusia mammillata]